jgi:hypothetical protein
VQFPPALGDIALSDERERLAEARIVPQTGDDASEALGPKCTYARRSR